MRGANFVYFFTVQGFFIGIVFALFQANSPSNILYFTFLITGFFYLFSHLCVAFYFRTVSSKEALFPKQKHEQELDRIIHEIDKREQLIDRNLEMNLNVMAGKNI